MAKDSYYFSHDYNARNDDKILELRLHYGAEGYGVFWMIVETMAENENGGIKASLIGGLSVAYGVAKDRLLAIIQSCIEIGLFYEENGFFFSRRMLTHKEIRTLYSQKGREGAEKRWKNKEVNGGAIEPLMQRKGKERKDDDVQVPIIPIQLEGQIKPPSPPMTEQDFLNYQSKLIQDALFIEPIMSSKSIHTKSDMLLWIKQFNAHIVSEEKIQKDFQEYRRHFKNWICKQDTSKPPSNGIKINHNSTIKKDSQMNYDKYNV